jgi:hypothetical protein
MFIDRMNNHSSRDTTYNGSSDGSRCNAEKSAATYVFRLEVFIKVRHREPHYFFTNFAVAVIIPYQERIANAVGVV